MSNKAVELALINRERIVRMAAELHVDRKKILQREIDELHQKIGKLYAKGDASVQQLTDIVSEIEKKITELESVKPDANNATNIEELTDKLAEYIIDHMHGKVEGAIESQIMPLMSRVMAQALTQYAGEFEAMVLLATNQTRMIILYCMVVGFMFYNLLRTHGIKIVTKETPVTEEDLEHIRKISQENREVLERLLFGGEDDPLRVPDGS